VVPRGRLIAAATAVAAADADRKPDDLSKVVQFAMVMMVVLFRTGSYSRNVEYAEFVKAPG